jgi:hypothetical protein
VLTDGYFLNIELFFGCYFHTLLILVPTLRNDLLLIICVPVLYNTDLARLIAFRFLNFYGLVALLCQLIGIHMNAPDVL